MPNLKAIKVRIKSIKSTQKITQAMKLVAASKVRKAQLRVLNSRPYTEKVNSIILRTVRGMSRLDKQENPLMNVRNVKCSCLIVITSDRGLCGSYNTNVIKRTIKRVLDLQNSSIEPRLIVVGNKAHNFFKRTKTEILGSFTQLPAVPSVELANLIANSAEKVYTDKKVDQVEIIGTDFISMLRNEVYIKHFLPISNELNEKKFDTSSKTQSSEILFEPTLISVIEYLLPLYLSNVIFHALLEASCSELASRMNAMSSATKNARELIDRLTIVYNKSRQAAITQELAEIVGGVEALKT